MTVVKICGIMRAEDALAAETCGADAVGFVFYPESPRYIEPAKAAKISAGLGPFVTRVGVFVNESPKRIRAIAADAGLDAIQLHGDEPPSYAAGLPGLRIIRAFRAGPGFDPETPSNWPADAYLLDACEPGAYGGTGRKGDWDVARACAERYRVILAGGLTPDNVGAAVCAVRPWGVDVSSGVESSPGVKDHDAVRAFFAAVRNSGAR